jgi:hypothetical protein
LPARNRQILDAILGIPDRRSRADIFLPLNPTSVAILLMIRSSIEIRIFFKSRKRIYHLVHVLIGRIETDD